MDDGLPNSTEPSEQESQLPPTDEKVGYGRPPQGTRFEKGRSGNPKGRPKGSRNLATELNEELNEKVVINEYGKRKTITKRKAAVKQLVNKAASGDLNALRQLTSLLKEMEQEPDTSRLDKKQIPFEPSPRTGNAYEDLSLATARFRARIAERKENRKA